MTNRNPVKQLFITFPQSGSIDKHQFRDALLRFEPDYYKICQETHKDGNPHLHAVVRFKNKYSRAFVIKYFKEKYPDSYKRIDVKPVRSIRNALAYISKEDTNPLESAEYKDNRDPQKAAAARSFNKLKSIANIPFVNFEEFIKHTKQVDLLRSKYYDIVLEAVINGVLKRNISIDRFLDPEKSITKDDMTYIYDILNIKV